MSPADVRRDAIEQDQRMHVMCISLRWISACLILNPLLSNRAFIYWTAADVPMDKISSVISSTLTVSETLRDGSSFVAE